MMRASWPLLLLTLGRAGAQNANPKNNFQFDPDVTETNGCNLPPYQDTENYHTPELGMCLEPGSTLTLADAQALAVDYAPYLYFHPLEKYTLTDMDLTFADPDAGKIYFKDLDHVFDEQLNQTAMLRSTRDPVLGLSSSKYFISHNFEGDELYTHDFFNPPAYLGGSGYDDEGLSNAPIYYRVYDSGNNTWTFIYWFYYAFNGHANMGVLSSYNGTEKYTPFQLRPIGQHEGDFEAISVQVCKSTGISQPLAIAYRQHSWNEITNCLEGNCHFFKDTFHPVGFAALNSHATYPVPTRNMLYANVAVPFFVNLQGVLVMDRTEFRDADGNIKQFLPNDSNVVLLKEPADIVLGETQEEFYWQAWGGSFGDNSLSKIATSDPNCLALDQHSFVECPTEEEDPVFTLVMQFLGVYPVNNTGDTSLIQQAASAVSGAVNGLFTGTGHGPPGPQAKDHNYEWGPPKNAPIWESIAVTTTEEGYCQRLVEIPDTTITSVKVGTVDVMGNIFAILAISVLLPLLVAGWYLWPRLRGGAFQPVIKFDDAEGNVKKPDRAAWWKVHRPALLFSVSFIFGLAGLITFANGYDALFDLLDEYVGGDIWEMTTKLILALGIIVMVLDVCFFIAIWIPTIALWRNVWIAYYEAIGDDENADKENKSFFAKNFTAKHVTYVVFFSLLFLSLMITTVCVIVGMLVVGFSYGFTKLCNETLGSIDGVCLDLSFIGINDVACGADFQEFCSEWGAAAQTTTLWGAFILLWAHFFFIAAAGESYASQVSIYPQLLSMKMDQDLRKSLLSSKQAADKDAPSETSAAEQVVEQFNVDTGVDHQEVMK